MTNHNITSTMFVNPWTNEEASGNVEDRIKKSNANSQAVIKANEEVAAANAEYTKEQNLKNAQTAESVGQGLEAAGTVCTVLSVIPGIGAGFAIAGAILKIAGSVTETGASIAESKATDDPTKAFASAENLASTTSNGVKEIRSHSATGETTLEEGAEVTM